MNHKNRAHRGRVAGKVALISGAARGLGAATAELLVTEGSRVMIADVREDEAQGLAQRLGPHAHAVRLDVTRRADWEQAVTAVVSRFGGLDVLINNAGIPDWSPIDEYDEADWRRILDVNLTGAFLGITAALPALKKSEAASIINVSSVAGLRGSHSRAGYTTSKWGLRGLTKAVALDVGQYGIRVNSVHPGAIETSMIDDIAITAAPGPGSTVALGRRSQPSEIAQLLLFLASDESSFSTGSEFIADGGATAGIAPSQP